MEAGQKVLVKVVFGGKDKKREPEIVDAEEFIKVKSVGARGKRLTTRKVASVEFIIPETEEEETEDQTQDKTLFDQVEEQSDIKKEENKENRQATDNDVEFEIKLPDGSQVKLDE
jgi:topoisomerase-4 subunit A